MGRLIAAGAVLFAWTAAWAPCLPPAAADTAAGLVSRSMTPPERPPLEMRAREAKSSAPPVFIAFRASYHGAMPLPDHAAPALPAPAAPHPGAGRRHFARPPPVSSHS